MMTIVDGGQAPRRSATGREVVLTLNKTGTVQAELT
jgi:hypothetical protein